MYVELYMILVLDAPVKQAKAKKHVIAFRDYVWPSSRKDLSR